MTVIEHLPRSATNRPIPRQGFTYAAGHTGGSVSGRTRAMSCWGAAVVRYNEVVRGPGTLPPAMHFTGAANVRILHGEALLRHAAGNTARSCTSTAIAL
jgi:hypothetical protein